MGVLLLLVMWVDAGINDGNVKQGYVGKVKFDVMVR